MTILCVQDWRKQICRSESLSPQPGGPSTDEPPAFDMASHHQFFYACLWMNRLGRDAINLVEVGWMMGRGGWGIGVVWFRWEGGWGWGRSAQMVSLGRGWVCREPGESTKKIPFEPNLDSFNCLRSCGFACFSLYVMVPLIVWGITQLIKSTIHPFIH